MSDNLSEASYINRGKATVSFNLYSDKALSGVFHTENSGTAGLFESTGFGPLSNLNLDTAQFELVRQVADTNSSRAHYTFEQKLSGLPVLFSHLSVHQDGQEIGGLSGKYLVDANVPLAVMTPEAAAEIAVETAHRDVKDPLLPLNNVIREVLYNDELFEIKKGQSRTYRAVQVLVTSATRPLMVNREYVVNIGDTGNPGEILFSEDYIAHAKSRQVHDCRAADCPIARDDGKKTAPVGDVEVDESYDIIGAVWDFYNNSFARDSIDGRGAALHAYVHFPGSGQLECPNAAWTGHEMVACDGMVARDVWAHEFTHGVTGSTARLCYQYQCGALNESVSDIFGWALDREDWQIGEEIKSRDPRVPIPLRYMDDPPKRDDPDRLFSPHYYCGQVQRTLVHTNSGILNKAFYLMVQGGNFNGCAIRAIGGDKALSVIYQALATPGYLHTTSNFKDAYDGVVRACLDLVGTGGNGVTAADCEEVKAALQAVEADQQSSGDMRGPLCTGLAGSRRTPLCASRGSNPDEPTGVPTTLPTLTPTPEPTDNPNPVVSFDFTDLCLPEKPATGIFLPYRTINFECENDYYSGQITDRSCQLDIDLYYQAQKRCLGSEAPDPFPWKGNVIAYGARLSLQGASRPIEEQSVQIGSCTISNDTDSFEDTVSYYHLSDGTWYVVGFAGEEEEDIGRFKTRGDYKIRCKGPVHLQRAYCDSNPIDTPESRYRCGTNNLTMSEFNYFDFSSATMFVGDVPPQNGVVNAHDIATVRNNFNTADLTIIRTCDLNFDGACNGIDHSLLIESLRIRYDQQ